MKKGFTLIELLAVIVILAIIALIATPIVLNIINDTKESATLRSAEYYLNAVEQSIMKKSMDTGEAYKPSVCVVKEDGNLLCDNKDTLKIEVKGEKPTTGEITFQKGTIKDILLVLGTTEIVKDSSSELVLLEPNRTICTAATESTKTVGNVPSGNFTPGDEYICEVKSGVKYNFFVLSTNGDNINLILDRNINSDGTLATQKIEKNNAVDGVYNQTEWITKEDYETANTDGTVCTYYVDFEDEDIIYNPCTDEGPVTALNFLNEATKSWYNIVNLNEVYIDDNYGELNLTGKARLPRYDELHGKEKCWTYHDSWSHDESGENFLGNGSCPVWSVNYMASNYGEEIYVETTKIQGMGAYWLLDSSWFDTAWLLRYSGYLDNFDPYINDAAGIRPVISVSKFNIK